jgi:peptide deformylase
MRRAKPRRPPVPAPIRQLGDPVLRTVADPVTVFDESLADTVELMFASMYEARGVGLAANQIGLSPSIFVMDCEDVVAVVVNPRLVELSEETETASEGCLSVLGKSYPTPRALMATVEGQDQYGKAIRLTGEGEVARCLQHETDHLNGRVYLDRLVGDVRKQARLELSKPVSKPSGRL